MGAGKGDGGGDGYYSGIAFASLWHGIRMALA